MHATFFVLCDSFGMEDVQKILFYNDQMFSISDFNITRRSSIIILDFYQAFLWKHLKQDYVIKRKMYYIISNFRTPFLKSTNTIILAEGKKRSEQ